MRLILKRSPNRTVDTLLRSQDSWRATRCPPELSGWRSKKERAVELEKCEDHPGNIIFYKAKISSAVELIYGR